MQAASSVSERLPMKVKFLRNTVANKKVCRIGDKVDLPDEEARKVISSGKAVALESDAKATAGGKGKSNKPSAE